MEPPNPILAYDTPRRRRIPFQCWAALVFATLAFILPIAWGLCTKFPPPDPNYYQRNIAGAIQFALSFTAFYFAPTAALVYGFSAQRKIHRNPAEFRGSDLARISIFGGLIGLLWSAALSPTLGRVY